MSKERDYHEDGSYTDRYDDARNTSVTYNSEGDVKELGRDESPLGVGDIRKTWNGDNECINVQKRYKD